MKRQKSFQYISGVRTILGLCLTAFVAVVTLSATGQAANVVPDPSFEAGTANWTLRDSFSSIDSTVARTGSKSMKLVNNGATANHEAGQYYIGGITAGTEYSYSIWVKGTALVGVGDGGKPLAVLRWRDSANNPLAKEMYMWASYGTYDWQQLKINLQAPPNAAKVDVFFRSWWDCLSGTSNWDDALLEPRDLSSRGAPAGTYQAENASAVVGGAIKSVETNYTGTGYVETSTSYPYIEWNNVDGGAGGTRLLSFRYTQEGIESFWDVYVNGVKQGNAKPSATGMINSWATHDFEVTLSPGTNTVRVSLLNVRYHFLIDKMDVFLKGTGTPTAATPTITPNGGSFTGSVAVSLSTTTPGAAIYYTTNGATPTTGSTRYTAPFTLTGSATVNAIAVASGYNNSAVASATFTSSSVPTAATPTISPNGGSFSGSVNVSLSTTTSGATIYYTTNGSTPGTGSTKYTAPFTLTTSATVKAIAVAAGYNNSTVASAAFTVAAASQQPYGGVPRPIPGTIEAEDYDLGGEGVAYHDVTAGNSGGLYRTDDVDIWSNPVEGLYAGDCRTGEWLEYTVNVAAAGQYKIDFRVTTVNSGRTMHAELDGVNVTGTVNVPNTGSWAAWQDVSATANLSAGQHVLRVAFDIGGLNLHRMVFSNAGSVQTAATPTISPNGGSFSGSVAVSLTTTTSGASIYYTTNGATPTSSSTKYTAPFTLTGSATVKAIAVASGYNNSAVASAVFTASTSIYKPYGGTLWSIPGIIEAENYDVGGEGVAYHDLTAGNSGGLYRTDDVDIWFSGDPAVGYYAGDCRTSEWLEYSVNVAATAQYRLDFSVCTPNAGRTMHAELDGVNVTGAISVPNTGSWSVWKTVSAQCNLSAGQHILRVAFDTGGLNLNRIVVTQTNVSPAVVSPKISPNGGPFSGSVSVSLSTTTPVATIYYTTNGSTPNTNSTLYTAPFTLTNTATVKAYAVAYGLNDSAVATASFTEASNAHQPYGGTPWSIPGIIEAENYDLGGEGLGYHDTSVGNMGKLYRTDDVDIWYMSAAEVGDYVGATDTGEWLQYTVDVESAGPYILDFLVATPNNGRQVHVEIDGVNVSGAITLPNTGSYSTWKTVSAQANLSAGLHVLRVAVDLGGFNFNRIVID